MPPSSFADRRPASRPTFAPIWLTSFDEYAAFAAASAAVLAEQRDYEHGLLKADQEAFTVPGLCHVCQREVALRVDYAYAFPVNGRLVPNWRERLVCPDCGFVNRLRATQHILDEMLGLDRNDRIYLTEQLTTLFQWMAARYPNLVGSEFLGPDHTPGEIGERGLRHEDLTQLSFADASLDLVLSFDVLEHVPDYEAALAECLRCLKPGGRLFFSVPFAAHSASTTVRARIDARGRIEHLLPPEYHGNPLSEGGCLCFYHHGWALLDDLRAQGFTDVGTYHYWSAEYGYLGRNNFFFVGRKPGVSDRGRG